MPLLRLLFKLFIGFPALLLYPALPAALQAGQPDRNGEATRPAGHKEAGDKTHPLFPLRRVREIDNKEQNADKQQEYTEPPPGRNDTAKPGGMGHSVDAVQQPTFTPVALQNRRITRLAAWDLRV